MAPASRSDERERIFEPFYRLAGSAESGRGSGLGLALVRQIARHHGGEVRCEGAEGGGSRFAGRLAGATFPPESDALSRDRLLPYHVVSCVIGQSRR